MTLDLKTLTQEERALWDTLAIRKLATGTLAANAYDRSEGILLDLVKSRRALFGEPASEGIGTGEFVTDELGSWEKCSRPDCDLHVVSRGKASCKYGCHEPASEGGKCVLHEEIVRDGPSKWSCETHPASEGAKVECEEEGKWTGNVKCPDCGRLVNEAHCGGPNHVYQRVKPAQPSPVAASSEMPEEVREAARILRVASKGYVGFTTSFLGGKADDLESWWRSQQAEFAQLENKIVSLAHEIETMRSQPAPTKVRMTEELKEVLSAANAQADRDSERGNDKQANEVWNAIAAVRAQAEQAQGVKLPKVRDGVTLLLHKAQKDPRVGLDHYESMLKEMFAELDAAEGVMG